MDNPNAAQIEGQEEMGIVMKLSNITFSPRTVDSDVERQANDIRERLQSALRIVDEVASVPHTRSAHDPVSEREIRSILKLRRVRDQFFGGGMFADPAWDILLELYANELGQQRITVNALCAAAAVPATTALRWINALERVGIIEREPDKIDARRTFLSLSEKGLEAMTKYFRQVPKGTGII